MAYIMMCTAKNIKVSCLSFTAKDASLVTWFSDG